MRFRRTHVLRLLGAATVGVAFLVGGLWIGSVSAVPLFDAKYRAHVLHKERTEKELAEFDMARVIEVMNDDVVVSTGREHRARTI